MRETSKAMRRRAGDPWWQGIFVGRGIDIGAGDDPLSAKCFPRVESVETFDMLDGDAQFISRYRKACSYDFVHSSNCLEHTRSPLETLLGWLHILKPGGHLVFTVPDEDLYEQGIFPSRWNQDHRSTFTLSKTSSWSSRSVNISSLISKIQFCEVRRIHLADDGYDRSLKGVDQTMGDAEAFWEVVLRKMPVERKKRDFKHSGARGDVIYGLASMREMGGGVLYLNRGSDGHFGIPMDDEELDGARRFLESLGYLDSVRDWKGEKVDVDMDDFRVVGTEYNLLSDSQMMRFGVAWDHEKPWIDPERVKPIREADIVVGRSERYHGFFDWDELKPWRERCVFVGTSREHEDFMAKTGLGIRRVVTKDWMELAGVIRGGKLYVGNQSMAYSLAEAMKVPRVLECCAVAPNCDPQGPDGHVRLTQEIIGRYVEGKTGVDEKGRSRNPWRETTLRSPPRRKMGGAEFEVVVPDVGRAEAMRVFVEEAKKAGHNPLVVENRDGSYFEEMAEEGAKKTKGQVICFVDLRYDCSWSDVELVVQQIDDGRTGMVGTCISGRMRPHVSGPCFAVSRRAYEQMGLFNRAMLPGPLSMLEMNLRYMRGRYGCKSANVRKWSAWTGEDVNGSDERNSRYISAVYEVKS